MKYVMSFVVIAAMLTPAFAASVALKTVQEMPFKIKLLSAADTEDGKNTVASVAITNGTQALMSVKLHCSFKNKAGQTWSARQTFTNFSPKEVRTVRAVGETDQYANSPTAAFCRVTGYEASGVDQEW